MQKYGLRIGNIGLEFPSVEDRQKAITAFTKGTDVIISNEGIKYTVGEGSFSVYDRETSEVLTVCCDCKGTFLQDTCFKRIYPSKNSWEKEYGTSEAYICEACYAQKVKAKEVFEAKKLLEKEDD